MDILAKYAIASRFESKKLCEEMVITEPVTKFMFASADAEAKSSHRPCGGVQ
jgi:hypothetical protein